MLRIGNFDQLVETASALDIQQASTGTAHVFPWSYEEDIVVTQETSPALLQYKSQAADNTEKPMYQPNDMAAGNAPDTRPPTYTVQRNAPLNYHFQTLQQWEGTVVEVSKEEFTSRLVSLTGSMPDKIATISKEEVSDPDQDLVKPGSVFYWTIGYRIELHGQKSLNSVIKFRRLPSWTRREIKQIEEIATSFDRLFE